MGNIQPRQYKTATEISRAFKEQNVGWPEKLATEKVR